MLSATFSVMIIFSFVCALFTGNLENMSVGFSASLADAVELCISLLGMMCFWSGLMNVFKQAGVIKKLSLVLKPLMKAIYGSKALDGENLDNLCTSVSANFLGLGNAALPLGINAVKGLEKNNKKGVAGDGTIMFAVLNTVPFQLIPSTLIALRTKHGSVNPFDVVPYIWICSLIITCFAVFVCKLFSKITR